MQQQLEQINTYFQTLNPEEANLKGLLEYLSSIIEQQVIIQNNKLHMDSEDILTDEQKIILQYTQILLDSLVASIKQYRLNGNKVNEELEKHRIEHIQCAVDSLSPKEYESVKEIIYEIRRIAPITLEAVIDLKKIADRCAITVQTIMPGLKKMMIADMVYYNVDNDYRTEEGTKRIKVTDIKIFEYIK